jgi:hypothetical protein
MFQYLFFELTALYFYRTILFFFSPTRFARTALSIFLFFNPLNLYLANLVSSDAMFATFSLLWLTTLIWIIYQPNVTHLLILSLACFIAFTFRYNAMYYPLIAAPVFILVRQPIQFKLSGLLLAPLMILPFILYTSNAARQLSGKSQFPPILGGWQWANNALYIRGYITEDTSHFPNQQMAELDQLAREFYRQVPPEKRQFDSYVGNFFIKEPFSPLKEYMNRHYASGNSYVQYVTAWAKPAPMFKEYGMHLIKKHPVAFLQHYMLMNTKNYFLPPLEKLNIFNQGQTEIWPVAVGWFDFQNQSVNAVSMTFQGHLLAVYPFLFLLLNVLFVWNLFVFIKKKGFQMSDTKFSYSVGLISVLVVVNAAFSIFANIVVFRYQVFPMLVLFLGVMLLLKFPDEEQGIVPKSSQPLNK